MCVVSMIGQHYEDKWDKWKDWILPQTIEVKPLEPLHPSQFTIIPNVTKIEFDALKKEVEEMKVLLKRAKLYDEQNNEPDCEIDSKVAFLKQMAAYVGVDLEEIFGNK